MLEARKELPGLEHVIVVDGEAPEGTIALSDVEGSTRTSTRTRSRAPEPEDVLTLIYTSGTTGPPKGVQLSHHNIMFAAKVAEEIIALEPGAKVISWLPAAHIAERMAHHYLPIDLRRHRSPAAPTRARSSPTCRRCSPTWFFAVPRIWEKLKAGLETMLAGQPEEQRRPIEEALAAVDRAGAAAPARRAGPGGARAAGRRGRREVLRGAPRDARARPGRSASTSAPRRRRSRCSSSSTRSGSSWPSCGACRRPAASGPCNRARRGQDRHGRAAGARRRDQARRRRRGAARARVRDDAATATCRRRPPRRSTPTAGCTPATSARSTTTAT